MGRRSVSYAFVLLTVAVAPALACAQVTTDTKPGTRTDSIPAAPSAASQQQVADAIKAATAGVTQTANTLNTAAADLKARHDSEMKSLLGASTAQASKLLQLQQQLLLQRQQQLQVQQAQLQQQLQQLQQHMQLLPPAVRSAAGPQMLLQQARLQQQLADVQRDLVQIKTQLDQRQQALQQMAAGPIPSGNADFDAQLLKLRTKQAQEDAALRVTQMAQLAKSRQDLAKTQTRMTSALQGQPGGDALLRDGQAAIASLLAEMELIEGQVMKLAAAQPG